MTMHRAIKEMQLAAYVEMRVVKQKRGLVHLQLLQNIRTFWPNQTRLCEGGLYGSACETNKTEKNLLLNLT